jgi:hypothetical protein
MGWIIATKRNWVLPVFVLFIAVVTCFSQEATKTGEAAQAPEAGEIVPHKVFPAAKITEEVIGEMTPGAEFWGAQSTEDHLAWVEKGKEGKRIVKLDGKQLGTSYDEVKNLDFSTDQEHLIWAAKKDSKWVIVLDGEVKSKEYGKLTSPTINANGKHFAVGACELKKCRLVVDGEEVGPEFEDISYAIFSKDGAHYAYGGKQNKKWQILLDGRPWGPEIQGFHNWYFSPDSSRLAVAALLKQGWTWVVDGTPGPTYEVLGYLDFSNDSKHFAYAGAGAKSAMFGKNKTFGTLVIDGTVEKTFEGKGFGGGWQGMFAEYKIVTGVRSFEPDFYGLSDPEYASDGTLVYAARRGENDVAVFFQGEAGPTIDDLVSPVIMTSDGKHIAYVGKKGEQFVEVRDQKVGKAFPGKRAISFVPVIVISGDGGRTAFEIVRGGNVFKGGGTQRALRRVVVDGKGEAEFDAYSINYFTFNSDGKHYAYEVIGAAGDRDQVVIDSMEGKLYDAIFKGSTKFIQDDAVEYTVRDGSKFYRVRHKLN